MKIPKETIDQIHQNIDIVEVISDFISLKKKGHYYSACCPFHNEKTPSFTVTPAKGIYKCFGCGKAGDAIQFVMEMEGLNYIEAMKYFAKKYGIEVKDEPLNDEEIKQQNERDSLYIVLNYAKNFYHDLLHNHDEGKSIGLSYFRERGFNDKTVEKFELGYSLEEWDAFLTSALRNNYQLEILEKAGLVLKRENANDSKTIKHYDRFRGRVIFPIHNVTGKVIAFGARILKNDKNQPKYINSPETEVYHKSKTLYGIAQAKQAIRQEDNCFLVEGYTDVISLHQGGIENVVASSGTSLTQEQIRLIKRYTENITVLYDGDPAGIKASIRGIDMILEEGMNVNVVVFPDNDDPDSYVRKIGGTEFKNFVKSAKKDFITFKTELFLAEAGNDPVKKAEVIREIVVSISKISDGIKRAVFFQQCSTALNIDEGTLIAEFNKIQIKQKQQQKQEQAKIEEEFHHDPLVEELIKPATEEINVVESQEREIVRLLLNFGSKSLDDSQKLAHFLLAEIQDTEIHTPLYKKFIDHIKLELEKGNLPDPEYFIRSEDEALRKETIDLISNKYELSNNWEEMHQVQVTRSEHMLDTMVTTTILRLKWRNIQLMIKENKEFLLKAQSQEDVETCQKIHMKLKEAEKQIAVLLGNVIAR
ncbi:MAG: DNA primase [Cytophagaceae bacterium]|nr:DNA primase [Cytophagaceae bacterium]